MPHNYKDYEVVQVAFPRNSAVLARLKEEAQRYTGRANAGPHIYELLVDRDAHLYGSAEGNGKGIWFPATIQIVAVAPQPIQTTNASEQLALVTESNADLIEQQAASMAAAFADDD